MNEQKNDRKAICPFNFFEFTSNYDIKFVHLSRFQEIFFLCTPPLEEWLKGHIVFICMSPPASEMALAIHV